MNRQDRFEVRTNRNIEIIPRHVKKMVAEREFAQKNFFVSDLCKYRYYGIVEEVYAVKKIKAGTYIEKIAAIPEDRTLSPVTRNCYLDYYNNFRATGLMPKDKTKETYMPLMETTDRVYIDYCRRYELFMAEDIIRLDGDLKYCSYYHNRYISAIDYIPIYREHPIAEMVMRLQLPRLLSKQALVTIEKDKAFRSYIVRNASKLTELSFQSIRGAYKRNIEPEMYAESLSDARSCASELAPSLSNDAREVIKKHTSYKKLRDYLDANNLRHNIRSYNDYIEACIWLQLNLDDTKVLYPKDFHTYHDLYTAQHVEYKKNQYTEGMKKTAAIYSFLESRNPDFCVIIAQSKDELIREGEALHHCVGRMNYDKKQADQESLICFIRCSDSVDAPFVTAEIGLKTQNLKLLQLYGDHDSVPDDAVKVFVNDWLKKCNRVKNHVAKIA